MPGSLLQSVTPFAIRLHREFRGVTVREGLLICGPSGWGEFAPFDDYGDEHSGRWLASALEAAYGDWPQAKRESVNVNAIIPAVTAEVASVLVRDVVMNDGCTTIKVKVTGDLSADEERISATRDALDAVLGLGVGRIRIDANACWSRQEAVIALRRLAGYGLEYVEQPVESNEDLRAVHSEINVPIAVDESIRKNKNLDAAAMRELVEIADVAIIKPAPVGGVWRAMEIADLVKLPVVVSNGMESSVGLCSALALAAALDIDRACGLGTGKLLATDVIAQSLVPHQGLMKVQRVAPDPEAMSAAQALIDPTRAKFWLDRLERAWQSAAAKPWHEKVEA
ncbi:MAG: o-succinylbenzoate synthase [Actinobacteria bacterium]|nr:o-succinylbenzoate synthase [Actinomycetota bacterium]MTB28329.1 o-succinylbenzoate synthase [Actinomycetota bacterium]